MTIGHQIRNKKLQYDINGEAANHQAKLISMNILLVKKYCHLIISK